MAWMGHAFLLSLLAGLSTGVGGMAVLVCRPGARMMAFSLGFAAGVMTTVSLTDLLPGAAAAYAQSRTPLTGALCAVSLCCAGMVCALLLGRCIPQPQPPAGTQTLRGRALHSAAVTMAALVLHNLPEGVLTMFTGYAAPGRGAPLALAVALHNLPEGLAVAVPVCYATRSRVRGVLYALASGLAEPLGALLAFALLGRFLTPLLLNGMVAFIAGVMLQVCAAELLPESFCYARRATAACGFCTGCALMFAGLYLV